MLLTLSIMNNIPAKLTVIVTFYGRVYVVDIHYPLHYQLIEACHFQGKILCCSFISDLCVQSLYIFSNIRIMCVYLLSAQVVYNW